MRRVAAQYVRFAEDGPNSPLGAPRTLASVVPLRDLASRWRPDREYLVPVGTESERSAVRTLRSSGVNNVTPVITAPDARFSESMRSVITPRDSFDTGDIVALEPGRTSTEVLFRVSDMHHTVFLTNRCNSRCVMCSQPPTEEDDGWRVDEAIAVAEHLTWSPPVIGFTGGEPLILQERLSDVLHRFAACHPGTQLEVLTNGRLLADDNLAQSLFRQLRAPVSFMVPLYGHAPFLHDYVVQAEGAFDETLRGLLNLQRYHQPVQLRVVLIRPVLAMLPALADFIARNLPFVREVALMGCEPIGFALAHPEECRVDLREWAGELRGAVRRLERGAVPVILMNTPLCSLETDLWPYAHQSISDWKRTYHPSCSACAVRDACCGMFASYERGWTPTVLAPVVSPTCSRSLLP